MRYSFRCLLLSGVLMVGLLGCGDSETSSSTGTLSLTSRSLSDLSSSSSLMGVLESSSLSAFTFTVKQLHMSTDGDSWVEVYNDETGTAVDILSTSSESAFSASVATGTYSYFALKIDSSITYQRAGTEEEPCTEQSFSMDEDIMSVITTETIFNGYGQESDGSGGYSSPTTSPADVYGSEANDEMFWVLSEAITISADATTTLALTAVTESLSDGECDDDPGKPVFSLVPVSE